jgi:Spy/CpxP family protein refolding chaperone
MKRVHTLTLVLVILALTAAFSLPTSAFARAGRHGADRLTRLAERLDSLDLNDQTRTTIHTTIDAAQATLGDIRRQLRDAHQQLRALMAQEAPDKDVLAQSDRIGALASAYRKHTLSTLLAVRALLTPEQRASLRESMRHHDALQKRPGNQ